MHAPASQLAGLKEALVGVEPAMADLQSKPTPKKHGENGCFSGSAVLMQYSDLAAVISAWPNLPAAIRAAILAMIQTAR